MNHYPSPEIHEFPKRNHEERLASHRRPLVSAGAHTWSRAQERPWYLREGCVGLIFTFAIIFGLTFGVLWLATGIHVPILTALTVALVLASVALSLLDRFWMRSAPAAELDAAARLLQQDGTAPEGAVAGRVVAVPHAHLPAILWNYTFEGRTENFGLVVTSQPLVVKTEVDTWLIDTEYVDVAGGTYVDDTLAKECRVGDKVFLYPADGAEERSPPWAMATRSGSGYRSQRVKRLLATPAAPARLVVCERSSKRLAARGPRISEPTSATASSNEEEDAAAEEAAQAESDTDNRRTT